MKIDNNVPLPTPRKRPDLYPWSEMEVGDSFFSEKRSVRGAGSYRGTKYGERYTTRTVTENGVNGIRVWRVE